MSAAPSIIRRNYVAALDNYTTIPNDWARDERLSYKARGLLLWLTSHREGFETSLSDMADGSPATKEGREAMLSATVELRTHGYLRVEKVRDGNGTFRAAYVLTDPAEQLNIGPLPTGSAQPTRRPSRSAQPTVSRSAQPTSNKKPKEEITHYPTQVQSKSAQPTRYPLPPSPDVPPIASSTCAELACAYVLGTCRRCGAIKPAPMTRAEIDAIFAEAGVPRRREAGQ